MRVLFINTTCGVGSHGRICGELAEKYEKKGNICKIAYGRGCSEQFSKFGYRIGNKISIYSDVLQSRLFDNQGLASKYATKEFLKWADRFNPDVLWLHNIHGYYINYELLFKWIKKRPNMKVRWTLHDCWAFTGHCGFFTMVNCNKWRIGCSSCPLKYDYPKSVLFDNSRRNYQRKKEAFTGVNNLTIITPSQWLAHLVKKSFLKEYDVVVQYNTIDKKIFKPTHSSFRAKYRIENKIMILGVANVWHKRKGLDDFLELAGMLNDDYIIVLVGFSNSQIESFDKYSDSIHKVQSRGKNVFRIDKGKKPLIKEVEDVVKTNNGVAIIPDTAVLYSKVTNGINVDNKGTKMILISRTDSPEELAGLYSTADFFVNPTHEDNYPTTNLEAQACGTYVITYDVGGSKETIK